MGGGSFGRLTRLPSGLHRGVPVGSGRRAILFLLLLLLFETYSFRKALLSCALRAAGHL